MANHNFPNVYPNIIDLSQIVTANAVTSCAYVGEAEFGPINTPILVSSLKNYTDKFGKINPKFGYMGYSLAVAADTINSHYVVRVVDKDSATYGSTHVALNSQTVSTYTEGYSIDEVEAGKIDDTHMAFFTLPDESISTVDAIAIIANNPNEKIIKVSIQDSTINTNKNILALSANTAGTTITLPQENLFEVDDNINVNDGDGNNYEGKITSIASTYNLSATVSLDASDPSEVDASVSYTVGDTFTLAGVVLSSGNALTGTITAVDQNGKVKAVSLDVTNDSAAGLLSLVGTTYQAATNLVVSDPNATGLILAFKVVEFKNVINLTYTSTMPATYDASTWEIRVLKLPNDNERTFSLSVFEVNGRVTTRVENFPYLTLFNNKDQYGNSTFIEDVVNSQSQYIQAFYNVSLTNEYPFPEQFSLRELVNGTSGLPIAKASNGSQYLNDGWNNFNDRTQVTVTLLMNSGYAYESDLSYQSKMIEVAEKRRDCFALLDIPQNLSANNEKVLDWRKNVLGFNTYRASLTTPWVKTYDSTQGKSNFLMCPSAYVAKIMGMSKPWIAPAGPNRGVISSATVSPIGLTEAYDEVVGGTLYDAQLNCIVRNPGAGWAVWGQKTLQQKPSALDRINVARTVIYIETTLRDAARYHLFENNTAFERMQVTLQFNQFLDTILADSGIQKYQVVCDDSNNTPYIIANNTMVIDIYLWPTYTTEFIELNTIVMGPDANITVTSNQ